MGYKRILLKLSGEALAPEIGFGISDEIMDDTAKQVVDLHQQGFQISIVVGGGNFWRGRSTQTMDRSTADYMGMLATIINGLALQEAIENYGVATRVMTAIEMPKVAEPYIRRKAVSHLEKGRIVIFSGGTGNPFFSTDTAAALRASETDCELVLFAKTVDGVYDKDPAEHSDAVKYDRLSYKDLIDGELKVMDQNAAVLLKENEIPSLVFKMRGDDSLQDILRHPERATIIGG